MNRRQRRREKSAEKLAEAQCRLLGWMEYAEYANRLWDDRRMLVSASFTDDKKTFARPDPVAGRVHQYLFIKTSSWRALLREDMRIRQQENQDDETR